MKHTIAKTNAIIALIIIQIIFPFIGIVELVCYKYMKLFLFAYNTIVKVKNILRFVTVAVCFYCADLQWYIC